MWEFLQWFAARLAQIIGFLSEPIFTYNGVGISILHVDIVFLVLGLVASVFWRGTKT